MEKLIMIKCPTCKNPFPLKRRELGYKVCINCSTEKPKVAVSTLNGQGDHTWNDVLIMDQDQYVGIVKREAEIKGKKINISDLDLDFDDEDEPLTYNELRNKVISLIEDQDDDTVEDEYDNEEEDRDELEIEDQ